METMNKHTSISPLTIPSPFSNYSHQSSPPPSSSLSFTPSPSQSLSSPSLPSPPSQSSTHPPSSTSQTPPPPSPPTPPVVISPCAACKILRRRCVDKCVLSPYFPPTEPYKFTIAHRVFGASNIIKFLQELPESQRADAVSSMVYEAHARIRDPVYGCAGVICQLQKQVSELQAQLAKAQAEVVNMQCQQTNLIALICMDMTESEEQISQQQQLQQQQQQQLTDTSCFLDENNLGASWEPLWT